MQGTFSKDSYFGEFQPGVADGAESSLGLTIPIDVVWKESGRTTLFSI
jgi:hypothetical protein